MDTMNATSSLDQIIERANARAVERMATERAAGITYDLGGRSRPAEGRDIPVADLKVGDQVWSSFGREWHTVTAIQGRKWKSFFYTTDASLSYMANVKMALDATVRVR